MSYKLSPPLVSVVIPMYNVEKYIHRALSSVLQQTYEHFEVICVDDESPDDSVELVKEFQDMRVQIIRQPNRGLAAARNTGIAAAKGKYVALLDADDFWAVDKLEQHVEHLEVNPDVDVSYCQSLFVDEQDELLGIGQYPKLNDISNKDILCRNPVGNGSAAVIRRTLLESIGKLDIRKTPARMEYFNEELRQSEDIEFWLRCALSQNAKFAGIGMPLTYYRVNAEGLSANLNKQYKSWQYAMALNSANYPEFFKKWYGLAQGYQLRYLSRRAIQSNMPDKAMSLISSALQANYRILLEEPKRTLSTLICASLLKSIGPSFNQVIEKSMRLKGLTAR
jgi:glycosyltransferase involved in cell wall biosynthesis